MPSFGIALAWIIITPIAFLTNCLGVSIILHYKPLYHSCDIAFISLFVTMATNAWLLLPVSAVVTLGGLNWSHSLCAFYTWLSTTLRSSHLLVLLVVNVFWMASLRVSPKKQMFISALPMKVSVCVCWFISVVAGLIPASDSGQIFHYYEDKSCKFLPTSISRGYAIFFIIISLLSAVMGVISSLDTLLIFRSMKDVALSKYSADRFHVPTISGSMQISSLIHAKYNELNVSLELCRLVLWFSIASSVVNAIPLLASQFVQLIQYYDRDVMETTLLWLLLIEALILPHFLWMLSKRYRHATVYTWKYFVLRDTSIREEDAAACTLQNFRLHVKDLTSRPYRNYISSRQINGKGPRTGIDDYNLDVIMDVDEAASMSRSNGAVQSERSARRASRAKGSADVSADLEDGLAGVTHMDTRDIVVVHGSCQVKMSNTQQEGQGHRYNNQDRSLMTSSQGVKEINMDQTLPSTVVFSRQESNEKFRSPFRSSVSSLTLPGFKEEEVKRSTSTSSREEWKAVMRKTHLPTVFNCRSFEGDAESVAIDHSQKHIEHAGPIERDTADGDPAYSSRHENSSHVSANWTSTGNTHYVTDDYDYLQNTQNRTHPEVLVENDEVTRRYGDEDFGNILDDSLVSEHSYKEITFLEYSNNLLAHNTEISHQLRNHVAPNSEASMTATTNSIGTPLPRTQQLDDSTVNSSDIKYLENVYKPLDGVGVVAYKTVPEVSSSDVVGHKVVNSNSKAETSSGSVHLGTKAETSSGGVHLGTKAETSSGGVHLGTKAETFLGGVHLGTKVETSSVGVHLGTKAETSSRGVHLGTKAETSSVGVHLGTVYNNYLRSNYRKFMPYTNLIVSDVDDVQGDDSKNSDETSDDEKSISSISRFEKKIVSSHHLKLGSSMGDTHNLLLDKPPQVHQSPAGDNRRTSGDHTSDARESYFQDYNKLETVSGSEMLRLKMKSLRSATAMNTSDDTTSDEGGIDNKGFTDVSEDDIGDDDSNYGAVDAEMSAVSQNSVVQTMPDLTRRSGGSGRSNPPTPSVGHRKDESSEDSPERTNVVNDRWFTFDSPTHSNMPAAGVANGPRKDKLQNEDTHYVMKTRSLHVKRLASVDSLTSHQIMHVKHSYVAEPLTVETKCQQRTYQLNSLDSSVNNGKALMLSSEEYSDNNAYTGKEVTHGCPAKTNTETGFTMLSDVAVSIDRLVLQSDSKVSPANGSRQQAPIAKPPRHRKQSDESSVTSLSVLDDCNSSLHESGNEKFLLNNFHEKDVDPLTHEDDNQFDSSDSSEWTETISNGSGHSVTIETYGQRRPVWMNDTLLSSNYGHNIVVQKQFSNQRCQDISNMDEVSTEFHSNRDGNKRGDVIEYMFDIGEINSGSYREYVSQSSGSRVFQDPVVEYRLDKSTDDGLENSLTVHDYGDVSNYYRSRNVCFESIQEETEDSLSDSLSSSHEDSDTYDRDDVTSQEGVSRSSSRDSVISIPTLKLGHPLVGERNELTSTQDSYLNQGSINNDEEEVMFSTCERTSADGSEEISSVYINNGKPEPFPRAVIYPSITTNIKQHQHSLQTAMAKPDHNHKPTALSYAQTEHGLSPSNFHLKNWDISQKHGDNASSIIMTSNMAHSPTVTSRMLSHSLDINKSGIMSIDTSPAYF